MDSKNLRRIGKWIIAAAILYFAVTLFYTVSSIEEEEDMSHEGSGTCYRVAAESRHDPRVRAFAEDRFLSRAECREIYQLVDQRAILNESFDDDKRNALEIIDSQK